MQQEVKDLFLSIKSDNDLHYSTNLDKARLFIKVVEALIKIETPIELKSKWDKFLTLKENLSYDYNEYQTNYNKHTYINRINIQIKKNLNLVNEIIKFYYSFVKDSEVSEDSLFELNY